MAEEKTYTPEYDENAMEFVHRVVNAQPDCEPLRIVEQLVEIAVGELKDRIKLRIVFEYRTLSRTGFSPAGRCFRFFSRDSEQCGQAGWGNWE